MARLAMRIVAVLIATTTALSPRTDHPRRGIPRSSCDRRGFGALVVAAPGAPSRLERASSSVSERTPPAMPASLLAVAASPAAGSEGGVLSLVTKQLSLVPKGLSLVTNGLSLGTKQLVAHYAIVWKVIVLKGPVENFIRRFLGGRTQRDKVWAEYTKARDLIISSSKLQGTDLQQT